MKGWENYLEDKKSHIAKHTAAHDEIIEYAASCWHKLKLTHLMKKKTQKLNHYAVIIRHSKSITKYYLMPRPISHYNYKYKYIA